jgi:hypothetical protein
MGAMLRARPQFEFTYKIFVRDGSSVPMATGWLVRGDRYSSGVETRHDVSRAEAAEISELELTPILNWLAGFMVGEFIVYSHKRLN